MRQCSKCKEYKDLDFFNKKRNGHSSYCKECNKANNKLWYKENLEHQKTKVRATNKRLRERNQQFIQAYLSDKQCRDCGLSDPRVLEFDHLRDKKMDVSVMSQHGHSIKAITEEISKCEVVCANCHRIRTKARRMGPSVK